MDIFSHNCMCDILFHLQIYYLYAVPKNELTSVHEDQWFPFSLFPFYTIY